LHFVAYSHKPLGTVTADIPPDLHHSEPTLEEAEKDRLSDPEILAMVLYTGAREDAESFEHVSEETFSSDLPSSGIGI
jgi:hypothetical protein